MNVLYQLCTLCVYIITCQIASGFHMDDYHIERLNDIIANRDMSMYKILPLRTVLNMGLMNNGHGHGNGHGNGGNRGSRKSNDDSDDGDDNDGDDNGDDDGNKKKKRGFITWFEDDKETVKTGDVRSIAEVQTTVDVDKKDGKKVVDVQTITDVDKKVGDKKVVDVQTMTDVQTTIDADKKVGVVSSVTADGIGGESSGLLSQYKNQMMTTIVNIEGNIDQGMAVAAPYMPIVCKVAIFIIPGLSQLQLLYLGVNVAIITVRAVEEYEEKGEVSSTTTDNLITASKNLAMQGLFKRDTGEAIKEYASNMYNNLKSKFTSFFSNDDDDSISTTKVMKVYENEIESPKCELIPNNPMPEYNLNVHDLKMVENLRNAREISKMIDAQKNGGSLSKSSNWKSDESSEELDISDITSDIIVDKDRFDKFVKESMTYQPEIIQNSSSKELIDYFDNMEINLPDSVKINTKKAFESITSMMDFDDSVDYVQINRLNDVLSKVTNFFIMNGIAIKN